MPDIGYYTLPVIPSFRGNEARLSRDLNRSFGASGTSAGKEFARNAGRAINSDKSIEKATETKAKAVDKLTLATSRVRAAEASLSAAETSGNIAGRARAVEAVTQARTREAAAVRQVVSATNGLKTATAEAQRNAAAAASGGNDGGTGAGMMGLMMVGRGGLSALTGSMGRIGAVAGVAARAGIVGAIGTAVVGAAIAPIVAGFKLFNWAAEVGLPLEKTMNTLQGVTNATGVEMAAAGREARQLGADIHLSGVTASDAATAMTELAKGGLTLQQAMAATRGTLQLATAGQLDVAQAAQIQSAAMNMFSLGADKAGHVADLLAAAANSSSAEVSDMGMALQQGGSVAAGFGVSIEDTLTALTAFSRMGINASDAGTMLKTSMLAITDQGKPAQGAIDELGLHLYDAQGKFVGYTNMLKQVADASNHMTQEQFQAATATLFGSDAMRAAMIAGNKGPELFNQTAAALGNVDGAAARMAGSQMQGLPGVLEGLDNTMDAVKLSVYDAGDAIFTALGQKALGGLSSFGAWVQEHQPQIVGFFTYVGTGAVAALKMFVSVAGDVTGAVALLVNGIGDTIGAFMKAYSGFQRLIGHSDAADAISKDADSMFGLADGIYKTRDQLNGFGFKLQAIQGDIQNAGDQANNATKFTVALGTAVADVPDGKSIVIRDNTPETIEHLKTLGIEVTETPLGMTVTATTAEGERIVNDWRKQQGLEPVKLTVKPEIDPGTKARLDAFFNPYKNIISTITPSGGPASAAPPNVPGLPGVMPHASGGITSYAFGRMPTKAIIQPATRGLVQWAEPSTHGEAFIPLNPGNRGRSMQIWGETGKRLGVPGFADGAITLPDVQAAMAMAGSPYSQGVRSDCSGMVARVILSMFGLPESAGLMSTKNAQQWLSKYGFRPGVGGPGSVTVGWYDHGPAPNDGHMAMTLSNGMHAEAGGGNGVFTIGNGAKGGEDGEFDQHMFLPVEALFPQGPPGAPGSFNYGNAGGAGGSPFGGTAGAPGSAGGGGTFNPATGTYGSFGAPDPKDVREAQEKVDDANKRLAIQEAQLAELKADAKGSERMQQQADVDKAKRERDDALADLDAAKKGKFTEGGGAGTGGAGGGDDGLSGIGGIMSQFMKDTFGLGDLFPDPSQIGIVKLLSAIMGIKYTPQGKGFPWQTGYANGNGTPFSGDPFGGGANPFGAPTGGGGGGGIMDTLTSMIPFGLGPQAFDPGFNPMAPGSAEPTIPNIATGAAQGGPPPGPVDNSNQGNLNVNVNGYSSDDVTKQVTRAVTWNKPRILTYTPPTPGTQG